MYTLIEAIGTYADQLIYARTYLFILGTRTINKYFLFSPCSGVAGHFSENGFVMDSSIKTIDFFSKATTTAGELSNALTVRTYKNALVEKRTIENNYQALRNQL